VSDRPGVLAHAASRLAAHEVSVAQLVQRLDNGSATLELVLHRAPYGEVAAALREIAAFPEVLRPPFALPVITEQSV
jgi:predicted amino acid-binding ACT domain protein